MNYHDFLSAKSQFNTGCGFEPDHLPSHLFPFQSSLVDWAVRRGRAAIFADCGMGKGPMSFAWAENVVRKADRPVLIVTTLGDSAQMVAEAAKFGVEAVRSRDGVVPPGARLVVTNYERLKHFDPKAFAGAVCNESSILKNCDGKTRALITDFMREMPYRLLCSATPAPNDFDELGTSAEALGEFGHRDMLTKFFTRRFVSDYRGWNREKWDLKGHASRDFWRWVCSWSRAIRKPSDLGPDFDDSEFVLPPLETREHVVPARRKRDGFLFDLPASGLGEEREERRRTIGERCEMVAELVAHDRPAIAWCHLNDEGDELARVIPDAVQVSGSDDEDRKEEIFEAFVAGKVRVLVTKPSIAGLGLNFQHCAHQTFFPSHSFEQHYQAVRRSWRYGQTRPVVVDIVSSEGEAGVLANLQRKSDQADAMFSQLVALMNESLSIARTNPFTDIAEAPTWLNPTSSPRRSRRGTHSTTATA